MTRYEYGNRASSNVLIQMVDDHDLSGIEREVNAIAESAGDDFYLVALKVDDWNCNLSPWHAPAAAFAWVMKAQEGPPAENFEHLFVIRQEKREAASNFSLCDIRRPDAVPFQATGETQKEQTLERIRKHSAGRTHPTAVPEGKR